MIYYVVQVIKPWPTVVSPFYQQDFEVGELAGYQNSIGFLPVYTDYDVMIKECGENVSYTTAHVPTE